MRLLIPLFLVIVSTACIRNAPYRAIATPDYPASHTCPDVSPELSNIHHEKGSWTLPSGTRDLSMKGYGLGFVEFDDFGESYNRCELLLEHALTQTLINVLERESYEEADCKTSQFSPPVDLITLINEAAPAIEAKKTLEYLSAHDVQIVRNNKQYPLLVSMTSQTDLATKLALPGGQARSLPFNSLRDYGKPDQFGIRNQRSYYLQSTANMTALQSHLAGNAEDPDIARAYHAAAGSQFAEFRSTESATACCASKGQRTTPHIG